MSLELLETKSMLPRGSLQNSNMNSPRKNIIEPGSKLQLSNLRRKWTKIRKRMARRSWGKHWKPNLKIKRKSCKKPEMKCNYCIIKSNRKVLARIARIIKNCNKRCKTSKIWLTTNKRRIQLLINRFTPPQLDLNSKSTWKQLKRMFLKKRRKLRIKLGDSSLRLKSCRSSTRISTKICLRASIRPSKTNSAATLATSKSLIHKSKENNNLSAKR